MVNIEGLDVADVLVVLWEHSKEQGHSFLGRYSGIFTKELAKEELNRSSYCDYINGRVIKCNLPFGTKEFDERFYDRDNGDGAAQRAVDELRYRVTFKE